jgi:predicted transposase/invertase (TIGR01784 family)
MLETLGDRLHDKGRKEGLQKGLQKGISLVARNMKMKNVDIKIIAETTGLSIEEFENITSQEEEN